MPSCLWLVGGDLCTTLVWRGRICGCALARLWTRGRLRGLDGRLSGFFLSESFFGDAGFWGVELDWWEVKTGLGRACDWEFGSGFETFRPLSVDSLFFLLEIAVYF